MIGQNPSVYAGDLVVGWGFSSELPCYAVIWLPYPVESTDFWENTVIKYNGLTFHSWRKTNPGDAVFWQNNGVTSFAWSGLPSNVYGFTLGFEC
jgi:hypothetical protein